jgi:hypothetical protein
MNADEPLSPKDICQRVVDLAEAQRAVSGEKIDRAELKRSVARAVWPEDWNDDLSLDDLPENISRALDKIVAAALFKREVDRIHAKIFGE